MKKITTELTAPQGINAPQTGKTLDRVAPSAGIHWTNFLIITTFHVLAVVALFHFSWQNLAVFLVLSYAAESLGIGIGYHRLLTHRSFRAPKWLEYVLTTLGTLAVQNGTIEWVATHRIHHAHTETDRDPHTPRHGAFWAHVGWIFRGTAQNHDEATLKRFVPDLLKDNFHVWLSRRYYVTSIILGLILLAIGGWSMVLWGVFLRTVFGWHSTWLVNSATHLWGTRRFETADDSTNNPLIAVLSFGEGWHNNHHAHPTSARHGLKWYEFDANWLMIRLFKALGWAKQVRVYQFKAASTATDADS
jgi:stearoyl-CoA desaturase (delta-9 desaturase)